MECDEEVQRMEERQETRNQRISNVSTIGSDLSEDDQGKFQVKNPFPSTKIYSKIFIKISAEQEKHYEILPDKLKTVLISLESELTPVNIREEKSIHACPVNLSNITSSRLCKRRSTNDFNSLITK